MQIQNKETSICVLTVHYTCMHSISISSTYVFLYSLTGEALVTLITVEHPLPVVSQHVVPQTDLRPDHSPAELTPVAREVCVLVTVVYPQAGLAVCTELTLVTRKPLLIKMDNWKIAAEIL